MRKVLTELVVGLLVNAVLVPPMTFFYFADQAAFFFMSVFGLIGGILCIAGPLLAKEDLFTGPFYPGIGMTVVCIVCLSISDGIPWEVIAKMFG